jgi:hypothetical protein
MSKVQRGVDGHLVLQTVVVNEQGATERADELQGATVKFTMVA